MPNGDWVNFPDDWSQDQIHDKIQEKFPDAHAGTVPVNESWGDWASGEWDAAKKFGHGSAQAVAGMGTQALDIGDWATNKAREYGGTPGAIGSELLFAPSTLATLANKFAPGVRKEAEEFASAPSTSPEQSIGYWSTEIAPYLATGGGAAAGVVKGTGKIAGREAAHLMVYEAIKHGVEAAGINLPSYLTYRLATNVAGRLLKKAGGKAAGKVAEKGATELEQLAGKNLPTGPKVAAPKPPPWGEVPPAPPKGASKAAPKPPPAEPPKPAGPQPGPAKPPGSAPGGQTGPQPAAPPKPRVRVPAGSRPVPQESKPAESTAKPTKPVPSPEEMAEAYAKSQRNNRTWYRRAYPQSHPTPRDPAAE